LEKNWVLAKRWQHQAQGKKPKKYIVVEILFAVSSHRIEDFCSFVRPTEAQEARGKSRGLAMAIASFQSCAQ
jgi:hypothetical protein